MLFFHNDHIGETRDGSFMMMSTAIQARLSIGAYGKAGLGRRLDDTLPDLDFDRNNSLCARMCVMSHESTRAGKGLFGNVGVLFPAASRA